MRVVGGLALLAIAAFCAFGFMATYEYSDSAERMPWQIGYGLAGFACTTLAMLCFLGWNPPMPPVRARVWSIYAGVAAAMGVGLALRGLGFQFLTVGAGALAGIVVSCAVAFFLGRQSR